MGILLSEMFLAVENGAKIAAQLAILTGKHINYNYEFTTRQGKQSCYLDLV